jgi:hypothetical protein
MVSQDDLQRSAGTFPHAEDRPDVHLVAPVHPPECFRVAGVLGCGSEPGNNTGDADHSQLILRMTAGTCGIQNGAPND